MSDSLVIGHRVEVTSAEGPFDRFALWVSGCTIRCPGCCNPHLFERAVGAQVGVSDLVQEIAAAQVQHGIEGVTLLGGEPFEQAAALSKLAAACQALGLGVIVFTGYELHAAQALDGGIQLWQASDTVVDGQFDAKNSESTSGEPGRRFIGSTNQKLHHRTARYADVSLWQGPRIVEIQWKSGDRLSAHGQPQLVREIVRATAMQSPQARLATSHEVSPAKKTR